MGGSVAMQFQSRNRGSFDFKCSRTDPIHAPDCRFNLVIEVLLISSQTDSSDAV